jgi:cytochrome c2
MRPLFLASVVLLLVACNEQEPRPERRVSGGDAARGKQVIAQVGCGTCHRIPGVRGARGRVGPPLDGFAQRSFIGGAMPNRPTMLIEWVRDAPKFAARTAMPPIALDEGDARDVAAYLYTLE